MEDKRNMYQATFTFYSPQIILNKQLQILAFVNSIFLWNRIPESILRSPKRNQLNIGYIYFWLHDFR